MAKLPPKQQEKKVEREKSGFSVKFMLMLDLCKLYYTNINAAMQIFLIATPFDTNRNFHLWVGCVWIYCKNEENRNDSCWCQGRLCNGCIFLSVSQHAFCKYLVLFLFQSTSVTFYRVHAIVEKQKEEMRAK